MFSAHQVSSAAFFRAMACDPLSSTLPNTRTQFTFATIMSHCPERLMSRIALRNVDGSVGMLKCELCRPSSLVGHANNGGRSDDGPHAVFGKCCSRASNACNDESDSADSGKVTDNSKGRTPANSRSKKTNCWRNGSSSLRSSINLLST